jgi:hypothetical protein
VVDAAVTAADDRECPAHQLTRMCFEVDRSGWRRIGPVWSNPSTASGSAAGSRRRARGTCARSHTRPCRWAASRDAWLRRRSGRRPEGPPLELRWGLAGPAHRRGRRRPRWHGGAAGQAGRSGPDTGAPGSLDGSDVLDRPGRLRPARGAGWSCAGPPFDMPPGRQAEPPPGASERLNVGSRGPTNFWLIRPSTLISRSSSATIRVSPAFPPSRPSGASRRQPRHRRSGSATGDRSARTPPAAGRHRRPPHPRRRAGRPHGARG